MKLLIAFILGVLAGDAATIFSMAMAGSAKERDDLKEEKK